MVEFGNSWNVFEEFNGDLLSILDFPLESLKEDGFVGDWDINSSSNVLGPPILCNNMIDMGPTCLYPGPVAPIARAPEREQLSNSFDASGSCIWQRNKFANIQESVAFESQSPVSVLESSGSCFGGMSLSIKPDHTIPVRSRSKRVRPMGGMNPWRLASPLFSSSQKTLNARRTIESKKKSFQYPVAVDFMKDSSKKVMSPLPVLDGASLRNAYSHRLVVIKKCSHCESTKTPQWREGPMGPKTLCNACGVRYRTGRLFPEYRPASSPSFVPSEHSNSHKKVIEMRNKGKLPEGKIKLAPISPQPKAKTEESPPSPQPEFVPMSSYLFDYIS